MRTRYQVGDRVIYVRDKATTRPGPRAKNIYAAPAGELYHYQVDKYWVVHQVQDDGTLVLKTRRGKLHTVSPDDPRLRKAGWWERLVKSHLFPLLDAPPGASPRAA